MGIQETEFRWRSAPSVSVQLHILHLRPLIIWIPIQLAQIWLLLKRN